MNKTQIERNGYSTPKGSESVIFHLVFSFLLSLRKRKSNT